MYVRQTVRANLSDNGVLSRLVPRNS